MAAHHRLGVISVAAHLALRLDNIITFPAELAAECFTKVVPEGPRPAFAAGAGVLQSCRFTLAFHFSRYSEAERKEGNSGSAGRGIRAVDWL